MNILKFPAIKVEKNEASEVEEDVCFEADFSLYLNNKFIANLTASPDQIEELGAGYVVCEGLADNIKSVDVSCGKIYVSAEEKEEFKPELRSSGCIGTQIFRIKKVNLEIKIDRNDVFEFVKALKSDLWVKTGGVHCSALFHNKKLTAKAIDIGRHNTIDKVVGYAKLNKINLPECAIACTGRQPKGMIFKASNAGIPIIISKAAPTDKGILAAKEAGITLVCFARESKFNIYTRPERIRLR